MLPDREAVLLHTVVAAPLLCPEIRLRLITADCELWKADEEAAARCGLVEPYWAFPWAGGQALARYVLDEPGLVERKRVLDLGSGCAIEAIAAAMGGGHVTVADIDPMAITAALLNAELNQVSLGYTTENLLAVSHESMSECGRAGERSRSWDVVLAGDVFYGDDMARSVLDWLSSMAEGGALVLIGDANRGFLNTTGLEVRARFDAPADNDPDGSFMQPATVYAMRRR